MLSKHLELRAKSPGSESIRMDPRAKETSVSSTGELPTFKFLKSANFVYQCRRPLYTVRKNLEEDPLQVFSEPYPELPSAEHITMEMESLSTLKSSLHTITEQHDAILSRRKVTKALLGMAMNGMMAPYFINSGGIEAVFKLIGETHDTEVLTMCASCLVQTTSLKPFILVLVNKHIVQSIITLIEHGNEEIRFQCARALSNLSSADADDYHMSETSFLSLLVVSGAVMAIQMLFNKAKRNDSVSFTLLSLCNIAPGLTENNDTEICVRFTLNAAKKLDILNDYESAYLVAEVFKNMTRIPSFTYMLCEEGILNVLLALVDQYYGTVIIVQSCTESIVNLSTNPKNRRKIIVSGIHNQLLAIFGINDAHVSTNILMMICNLLRVGYFHDRIARQDIVQALLGMLHHNFLGDEESFGGGSEGDEKSRLKQFLAATHCVAEMAKVNNTAEMIMDCGVVSIVLRMLHQILPDEGAVTDEIFSPNKKLDYDIEVESMSFLWAILASLSNNAVFLTQIIQEPDLVKVIKKESEAGLNKCRIYVAHLLLHVAKYLKDSNIDSLRDKNQNLSDIIFSTKRLLSYPGGRDIIKCKGGQENSKQVVSLALYTLVYLAENIVAARSLILANDFLQTLEALHIEDSRSDIFSVITLLYILSKEESLSIKLLEGGIHNHLVAYAQLVEKEGAKNMTPQVIVKDTKKKGRSRALTAEQPLMSVGMFYTKRCGDLIAATLLNLSLKRGVLGTGVLNLLLSLLKNCKSSRAMWIARCLAHISVHPRAKSALAKEARLVAVVTGIMRNGCEEADKAQLHCATVICNFVAQPLPKATIDRMIKDGEVIDLVVVTLLRVSTHTVGADVKDASANSLNQHTKESLGRALFNLLSRADSRAAMVKQSVFEALVDLSKMENVDILELSVRAMYNISCETSTYSAPILKSGVPAILSGALATAVNVSAHASTHQGARPTHKIKLICAKTIANISFDLDIALALAKCVDVTEALSSMHSLQSQEATYCMCAVIYNLFVPETSEMMLNGRRELIVSAATANILTHSRRYKSEHEKDSMIVVNLLVQVLKGLLTTTATPLFVGQLAAASLCNMSLLTAFHEQMSVLAVEPMIGILTSPRCNLEIKIDVIRFLFNVIPSQEFPESRYIAIKHNVVAGILSALKLMTPEDEPTMSLMGTIILEISGIEESNHQLILAGISKALVRLAKVESPPLKLDIARALLRLTFVPEGASRILQIGDGVEALFWLTIHDCLGEFGPILANVARALKNFAMTPADCIALTKEERLFNVYKVLAKSESEDVLWQTAASIFLILKNEEAKPAMIKRGVVPLIFSLAVGGGAGGFRSVRYLCSAALHSIPDALPDMKDPAVLPLVLCLLEINEDDQGKYDPDARVLDEIVPAVPHSFTSEAAVISGSTFSHTERCFDFENSPGAEVVPPLNWVTMTCDVDHAFSPIKLELMTEEDKLHSGLSSTNSDLNISLKSSGFKMEPHQKLTSADFGEFKGEMVNHPREISLSQSRDKDRGDAGSADANVVPLNSLTDSSYANDSFESSVVVDVKPRSILSRDTSSRGSKMPVQFEEMARSPSKRLNSAPGTPQNTVSAIKMNEYSPTRKPRSGGSMTPSRYSHL